jgi:hypothetical protein
MSRREAESTERGERRLYPGAKRALTTYLRQDDEQIAILLEETAEGFSEGTKALLPDNILFLLNNREARPDLFGHIGPDCRDSYGVTDFLLTAEVRDHAPTLGDVYQAKLYGELFSAPVALLISTELPEERLRRLLIGRPDLVSNSAGYQRLYMCCCLGSLPRHRSMFRRQRESHLPYLHLHCTCCGSFWFSSLRD